NQGTLDRAAPDIGDLDCHGDLPLLHQRTGDAHVHTLEKRERPSRPRSDVVSLVDRRDAPVQLSTVQIAQLTETRSVVRAVKRARLDECAEAVAARDLD